MAEQYITLTEQNFAAEVLNSEIPVLVDFWAPWCGPCRVMNPIIKDLAAEFNGVVKVAKLSVDEYEQVASNYHIEAIPTIIFFQQGQEVERFPGLVNKATLTAKIKELTGNYQVAGVN